MESFGEAEKAINTAVRTGRFFEREVNFGLKLLQTVRLDLEDVAAIVQSGKKQTNHHRALIQQLNKGIIPKSEVQGSQLLLCSCLGDRPCPESEAADKGEHYSSRQQSSCFETVTVWMGGLFNPEAFITATRLCVTQVNSWSLQELSLDVTVADEADSSSLIQLPVCLNSSRANLIFTVNLPLAAGQKKRISMRGESPSLPAQLSTPGERKHSTRRRRVQKLFKPTWHISEHWHVANYSSKANYS